MNLITPEKGLRKYSGMFLSLAAFFVLTAISLFFVAGEHLTALIAAIAGGITAIVGVFYKYNKDVHVKGNTENAEL